MAFALSSASAYQIYNRTSVSRPDLQVLEFTITRANTDTDLDLFDASGTFWTAVGASGVGLIAKTALTPIFDQVAFLVSCAVVGNNAPLAQVVSSPAAGSYVLSNDGTYPVVKPAITLVSGSGATSLKVCLVLSLNSLVSPVAL
jgi:hypothetical protein